MPGAGGVIWWQAVLVVDDLCDDAGPAGLTGLRRFDDDLGGALDLVVSDLVETGAMNPTDASDLVWRHAQGHLDSSFGPDAGGEVACAVAETVQEHLIEARADHVWPPCPDHRNHPLWLSDGHDPWWVCPVAHKRVAPLGGLR